MSKIQALVLPSLGATQRVEQVDKPSPSKNYILVKNHAIALNPADWKQAKAGFSISSFPAVIGCDASGVVEAVGPDVTRFKPGDEVMAFTKFGIPSSHYGAFSEYSLYHDDTALRKPPNLKFEQAATIGVGMLTAGVCLYKVLNLPLPYERTSFLRPEYILVWGGASSVGCYAVQLARSSGYTVIATASPRNHDYLRSLGVEHLVDYRAPDAVEQIRKLSGGRLKYAIDCIGPESANQALEALADSGAKLVTIAGSPNKVKPGVDAQQVMLASSDPGMLVIIKKLVPEFETLLETGEVVPNQVEILPGGLSGIASGLETLEKGAVSCKKLVVLL